MNNKIIIATLICLLIVIIVVAAMSTKQTTVNYQDGCHCYGGQVWSHDDHRASSALRCMQDHSTKVNGVIATE